MHRLVEVESAAEWRVCHAIRREVLFDTGIFPFVYDENRPEDRAEGNTPYLLMLDDEAIGTLRLDQLGAFGVVRMVAIIPERQRKGHGRAMSELVHAKATAREVGELRVNAYKESIGFYERTGWVRRDWGAEELARLASGNVQMVKRLG